MKYHVLKLDGGWKAIVTQYGERLLGPFKADDVESVLWVNSAMKNEADFRDFVAKRSWNLGSERFWLNPELRFYCDAPELFDDTYTVQEALDPSSYALEGRRTACTWRSGFACAI